MCGAGTAGGWPTGPQSGCSCHNCGAESQGGSLGKAGPRHGDPGGGAETVARSAPTLHRLLWIPAAGADLRSREAGVQAWLSGPRRWSLRRPSAKSSPRLVLVRVRDAAGCQRLRDPCDSLQVGDAKALAQGSGRCLEGVWLRPGSLRGRGRPGTLLPPPPLSLGTVSPACPSCLHLPCVSKIPDPSRNVTAVHFFNSRQWSSS